jgi:hypothetical protein
VTAVTHCAQKTDMVNIRQTTPAHWHMLKLKVQCPVARKRFVFMTLGSPIMPSPADEPIREAARVEFYRRPEKPADSICMFCFVTVRAPEPGFLGEVEAMHRMLCMSRPTGTSL